MEKIISRISLKNTNEEVKIVFNELGFYSILFNGKRWNVNSSLSLNDIQQEEFDREVENVRKVGQ